MWVPEITPMRLLSATPLPWPPSGPTQPLDGADPFTDLVGVAVPVMQGGMSSVATATLVAAMSEAGGLGTLGAATFGDERALAAEIDAARAASLSGG